jgi:hypothetical protein
LPFSGYFSYLPYFNTLLRLCHLVRVFWTFFVLRCAKNHSVEPVLLQTAMTQNLYHRILFLCNGCGYLVSPFYSKRAHKT